MSILILYSISVCPYMVGSMVYNSFFFVSGSARSNLYYLALLLPIKLSSRLSISVSFSTNCLYTGVLVHSMFYFRALDYDIVSSSCFLSLSSFSSLITFLKYFPPSTVFTNASIFFPSFFLLNRRVLEYIGRSLSLNWCFTMLPVSVRELLELSRPREQLLIRVGVKSGCYLANSFLSLGFEERRRGEIYSMITGGRIVDWPKGEKWEELLSCMLFDRFMIFFLGNKTGFSGWDSKERLSLYFLGSFKSIPPL